MRVLELHASVKTIQRSKGHSATAAAAYRAAERIKDERTGEWKDYRRKSGVEHTAIFLPENAPDWAHDRSRLWNAAEAKENRSNSRTARELEISFPHEMTPDERRSAGYLVAQELVDRYGSAVDIAFHAPSKEGSEFNHHAHILFTTRGFDLSQADGWAKNKERLLDDRKTGPEEVLALRERVATVMNDICARAGHEVYVEHLSFEKRGLNLEATQHLGPLASDMERKGLHTDIGDKNRKITAANTQRLNLEKQKNVVDLAAARTAARDKNRRLDESEAAEIRRTALQRRTFFYKRVQRDRAHMIAAQNDRFGSRETALKEQLAALHRSTTYDGVFGLRGLFHRLTGRRADELQAIAEKQRAYERIQADKTLENARFEQQRQRQLFALIEQEARQRAAWQRQEFIFEKQRDRAANDKEVVRKRIQAYFSRPMQTPSPSPAPSTPVRSRSIASPADPKLAPVKNKYLEKETRDNAAKERLKLQLEKIRAQEHDRGRDDDFDLER